jgi:hypothetical protein
MKLLSKVTVLGSALLMLAVLPSRAQQDSSDSSQAAPERTWGDYRVHQSFDFGYRYSNITGNQDTYQTFVNLNSGFRLLDQTFSMQSLDHNGLLFDSLTLSSFGYGGDPNNVTRLRIEKNHWYDFAGTFRRDENFWNYNLLANPLNPLTSMPSVPITFSPHAMDFVRRMSDLQLTLLPQSKIRTRLGYSHDINEGPSFSSYDNGTVPLLSQVWRTSSDSYRFGFDYLAIPKTRFSYDQFFEAFKDDTSWGEGNLRFQLSNGAPVDLGLVFDTVNGSPCNNPILNPFTKPPTADDTCNGIQQNARGARPRNFFPTEQFSFESTYFKNLAFTGRFTYSTADSQVHGFNQFFLGLDTRTNERQITASGPADTRRVSASADFAATWAVTSKLQVLDTFRFDTFRLPGQWISAGASFFAMNNGTPSMLFGPAIFNPANCPPPFTAPTCPQHNDSSPADVTNGTSSLFFGQNLKSNTLQLEYDFTRRFGGHIGYRYAHREITQHDSETTVQLFFPGPGPVSMNRLPPGSVDNGDGTFTFRNAASNSEFTPINEHTALFGIWTRPIDALRINFDLDLLSADRSFMRISPRQLQHYRLHVRYNPIKWGSFDGNADILESRDNVATVHYLDHNRMYGFAVALQPRQRYSFDLGYNYNDVFSAADICYFLGFNPSPSPCPLDSADFNAIGARSFYTDKTHTAYVDAMFHPIRRVTALLGYAGTFTNGNTLFLNPNSPVGPLSFAYQKPFATLSIDLWRGVTYRAAWNYYGYNERSPAGPTGLRDFNGNSGTFSIHYAF